MASDIHAVRCPTGTPRGGITLACVTDGGIRCDRGVYTWIFDGDCRPLTDSVDDPFQQTIPIWGQFNYSSNVPVGASILFEVRAADTISELATSRVVSLPDAPRGTPDAPTRVGLRALLRAASILTDVLFARRYLQLTAYLIPSFDGDAAPTLISIEIDYACYAGD